MKFDSVKAIENYYSHFQNWSLESIYKHIKKEFPEVIINTNKGAAGQVLEGLEMHINLKKDQKSNQ